MSMKSARIHKVSVLLDASDKKLLEELVRREKLPQTEMVRQLIRRAARTPQTEIEDFKLAANG